MKVKPLKWTEFSPENFTAETVHGDWMVLATDGEHDDEPDDWGKWRLVDPDHGNHPLFEDPKVAMQLANTLNEERIKAFLIED